MFRHYANVIEELEGEPILPAEEQILRAREAVEERDKEELDALVADLLENPTISAAQRRQRILPGAAGVARAAMVFYAPNKYNSFPRAVPRASPQLR